MNNPNDSIDDNDFDTDLGFDDSTPADGGRANNPLMKIGLIAAAVVVVVGGIMMMTGGGAKTPPSQTASATPSTDGPSNEQPTPEYQQAVQTYNQQEIEQAKEQGTSAIGISVDPLRNPLIANVETKTEEDPNERFNRAQAEYQTQQAAADAQRAAAEAAAARAQAVQAMASNMSSYLSGALAARQPAGSYELDVGYVTPSDDTTGANGTGTSGSNGLPPLPPARVLLPATTIEYGQLMIEANTDAPGPVLAMLASGKLSGARLLGSFQKTDEYLTLNFNQLVTKDGRTVPIQAIALDPKTTLPGMVTDIDRKYFQRIIVPAAAEFISGVGQAIAETKTTTTQNDSSTTTASNDPNYNEAIAQGITRGFDSVADVLKKDAGNKQIMLRVAAGTPIGILFTAEVIDPDDAAAQREHAAQLAAEQDEQTPIGQMQQFIPVMMPGFTGAPGNPYVQAPANAPTVPNIYPTAPAAVPTSPTTTP